MLYRDFSGEPVDGRSWRLTPPITSVDLVSCMPKPLPAVVRLDSIPSALCNASQGVAGPRSMLAYVLFLKSPARLNGIEIV